MPGQTTKAGGRPYTTPWVRTWLARHPDEAMAVESMRLTTDGSLALFGSSARGPFQAVLHVKGGPQDGYRGHGVTVAIALEKALKEAKAAA
jgi:hypothetical protein